MELIYTIDNNRLFIGGLYDLKTNEEGYKERLKNLKAKYSNLEFKSVPVLTLDVDDNIYTIDSPKI